MNRPMRRSDRALSEPDALAVLDAAPYVCLATVDEDGEPYNVPLSPVREKATLYFHATAQDGHKFLCFQRDARACAVGVSEASPLYQEDTGEFTTLYASAMVFGRIRPVLDEVERKRAVVALCMRYAPEAKTHIGQAMRRDMAATSVWALDIERVTGKSNIPAGPLAARAGLDTNDVRDDVREIAAGGTQPCA